METSEDMSAQMDASIKAAQKAGLIPMDAPMGKPRRKKGISPTQRTLAELRKRGYLAAVVERWNPHAMCRQDLFGLIDVIGLREGETIAVQTTTGSNVADRVQKIADSDKVGLIRKAGWRVVIHGWRKNAEGRWTLREVDCS